MIVGNKSTDSIIKKRKHTDPYKYFYMLMMFLWTAKTTPLLSIYSSEVKYASIIHLFIIVFYWFKYCKKANFKPLKTIFLIFFLWYIAICIKFNGLQPIYTGIIYNSIIAFIAWNVFRNNDFFYYFEKVLTHLCLLSLVIWGSSIFLPGIVPKIMKSISIYENGATLHSNIILVGLSDQMDYVGIRRNLGFTWEAGRFSCYLVLGCFLYITTHHLSLNQILKHKHFIIYLITLFSTLSTTGYGAFFFVILYYIYNKNVSSKLFLTILLIILIPTIWSMPFISEKIIKSMDVTQEISNMTYSFEHGREVITPQRITGLFLEYLNICNDFWFGYGVNENSFIHRDLFKNNTVWLSNGCFQIFSMYGILVGTYFYFLLFQSSRLLISKFNRKGIYFFAFTFILISISYDFWANSLCLFLIYQYLFNRYSFNTKKSYA